MSRERSDDQSVNGYDRNQRASARDVFTFRIAINVEIDSTRELVGPKAGSPSDNCHSIRLLCECYILTGLFN
jgi:hypothetical protein